MTPRRVLFTMASFVVVVVIMVTAAMRSNGPVRASFTPDAYQVSQAEDTNPDPNILETSLTAQAAAVDIGGGLLASVLTFNGVLPGPQLRVKVGDTVIVHFRNNIAHATGIHWHGIQVPNASDGTPLTQDQVPPGGSFLYRFTANRPGIYWYHPHHHSSTNQVFKGLYGSLIVTDPNDAALVTNGTLPRESETQTLVFSDLTVCKAPGSNDLVTYDPTLPFVGGGALPVQPGPTPKELCETTPLDEDGNPRGMYAAGEVPNIQRGGHSGRVNEGQTITTNGVNVGARAGSPSAPGALSPTASVLDVRAGQGLRLQMINAAAVRFMRLRLTTSTGVMVPLVRVGGQGGLLDYAVIEGGNVAGFDFKYDSGQVLLDPGDRAEVVAVIPADATGVLTLWTEDFSRTGLGFARIPTVPVAHFEVTGPAATPYAIAAGTPLRAATGNLVPAFGAPTLALLDPAAFAAPKPGLATQNISLTNTAHGLGINWHHRCARDVARLHTCRATRFVALRRDGRAREHVGTDGPESHPGPPPVSPARFPGAANRSDETRKPDLYVPLSRDQRHRRRSAAIHVALPRAHRRSTAHGRDDAWWSTWAMGLSLSHLSPRGLRDDLRVQCRGQQRQRAATRQQQRSSCAGPGQFQHGRHLLRSRRRCGHALGLVWEHCRQRCCALDMDT